MQEIKQTFPKCHKDHKKCPKHKDHSNRLVKDSVVSTVDFRNAETRGISQQYSAAI